MTDAPKAVFLSYAREDTEPAKRIADALRAFGVEVWFDQSELRGGDAWDQKIRNQIKSCALFIPLVSGRTEERAEGYFRREWKLAVDRTHDMVGGRSFIVPVAIDDTPESRAAVPEEFMRYQWMRLPSGEPSPQFVEQIKRLLEAPRKPAPGAAAGVADPGPASPRPVTTSKFIWGVPMMVAALAVGVVGLAIAAWSWLRHPAAEFSEHQRLEAAATPSPAAPAAAKADDKSVAVLAFTDLSEKKDSEYFSDGVSEDLLDALAKVPGLRVAARTSAFFFKGKNVPIPEIAQKLNVAYVVEGSVQRAGNNVRITAQLIKAADGYHVWSEHFDRELQNVFAVQDEIAGLVAKQLSLKLGASSAVSTVAVNPQAFELYLQARQAWNLRTAAGFDHAEELLNRALVLEPSFARAYAAIADVWQIRYAETNQLGGFGQRNSPEATRLLAQCERALALDPSLSEAHAAMGGARWICWQLDAAARELRLAISLNPNYATAHQILGRVLMSDGRFEDALAELKRATELDPLSHRILDNYSGVLHRTGRYPEALEFDERALAIKPDAIQAAVWKALDLSALGRHDEAVAWLRRFPTAGTIYGSFVVGVFWQAGSKVEAEAALKQIRLDDGRYAALAAMGRTEEALAAMQPAIISIQPFDDVFVNPAYDPIRHDPRFVQVLATLGMTEAHARAQAWRAARPNPTTKQ
jgi:TolB-like protein